MRRVEVLFVIFVIVTLTKATDDVTRIETCNPGDVVQNECLQCVCNSKNIYRCTPKQCSRNNKEHSMENLILNESDRPTCRPSVVYSTDTATCICDRTGHWPHSKCEKVFQTLNDTNYSCEADSYVILDCNVCHCGADGKIEKDRCTKNVCEEVKLNTRRYTNNVYGSCEAKTWYSLAPCQFCFCIKQNKLVCNTGNYYAKKLDLGSYHLNVCGKDLIYEAIALLPDNRDLTLRIGNIKLNNTDTTTPPVVPTFKHVKPQEVKKINLDVKKGQVVEGNIKDTGDSTSESDEEIPIINKKIKDIPMTQLPYIEHGEDSSKDIDYKELDSGLDIDDESKKTTPKLPTVPVNKPLKPKEPITVETLKNIGENLGKLKLNLPEVLDRMFRMALRKSMLSLTSDVKCEPGTTKVMKCNNICFCMKNGKLLCTNNVCE